MMKIQICLVLLSVAAATATDDISYLRRDLGRFCPKKVPADQDACNSLKNIPKKHMPDEGMRCDYEFVECCGETYPTVTCECYQGIFACEATEACSRCCSDEDCNERGLFAEVCSDNNCVCSETGDCKPSRAREVVMEDAVEIDMVVEDEEEEEIEEEEIEEDAMDVVESAEEAEEREDLRTP